MKKMVRGSLVPLAALGGLALASPAQALTKTVFAGPPAIVPGVFGPHAAADADAFSQRQVTIHVGDSVRWQINGFHTVTFNKAGAADIAFIVPAPGTYPALNDLAGQPYWFKGQPRTMANPLGAFPRGGKIEDGSAVNGTGLPIPAPRPYALKFPKAGVFKYECIVHPGMDATVRVVARSRSIPSVAADKKAVARQLAAEVKLAKKLLSFAPAASTTNVSAGNDQAQVAALKFFPATVHVPVGGKVTFSNTSKTEPHTITFGPPNVLEPLRILTPVPNPGGPPTLLGNPLVVFPSDLPPALPPYDGTAHGNGFFNTGVIQSQHPAPPPPAATITFTKAGTFPFVCLIHKGMMGKVIVG